MYKIIILPIDLSSTFKKPMLLAIELAEKFSSKIIVLNVLEEYLDSDQSIMSRVSLDSINADIEKESSKNTILIKNRFSEILDSNLDIEIEVKTGEAADCILDLASDLNADTIIMGSNGKDDISDFFMGTTSSKVLENSTIPVLVVPNTD